MAYPKLLHDNRLDDATPVASTTATSYDVLNLRDGRAYTFYKPETLPAIVEVDCGANTAASALLVWGHTLSTNGCRVEVWGAPTGSPSAFVQVATHTPSDDYPFLLEFNSASYRYWQIQIVDAHSGATAPQIAIAVLGVPFVMPEYLAQGFDPRGRTVDARVNRSADGYPLGSVTNFEAWAETLTFDIVTWAWLRNTFEPVWRSHLRDKPFILAWDTDSDPDVLHLITTTERGFKTPHKSGSRTPLSFEVVGLLSQ
jgi:hypothetical protein